MIVNNVQLLASRSDLEYGCRLDQTPTAIACQPPGGDSAEHRWFWLFLGNRSGQMVHTTQCPKDFGNISLAITVWALTDSAACTLGSWWSEALGGGAEGDGSRAKWVLKDERPKLGHFSLQDPIFFDLKFVLNFSWIFLGFFSDFGGFWRLKWVSKSTFFAICWLPFGHHHFKGFLDGFLVFFSSSKPWKSWVFQRKIEVFSKFAVPAKACKGLQN